MLGTVLAHNILKVETVFKESVSEKQLGKDAVTDTSEIGECVIRVINTPFSGRSDMLDLSVCWTHCWESAGVTFCLLQTM
jgi:hypothetical protein